MSTDAWYLVWVTPGRVFVGSGSVPVTGVPALDTCPLKPCELTTSATAKRR